jgi:hypothetical protein
LSINSLFISFYFTHVFLNTVILHMINFITQFSFVSLVVQILRNFIVISLSTIHIFIHIPIHNFLIHLVRFIMVISNSTLWPKRFSILLCINLNSLICSKVSTQILVDFHSVKTEIWFILSSVHLKCRFWTVVSGYTLFLQIFIWFHDVV